MGMIARRTTGITRLFAALLFALALTACGGGGTAPVATTAPAATTAPTTAPTTASAPTTEATKEATPTAAAAEATPTAAAAETTPTKEVADITPTSKAGKVTPTKETEDTTEPAGDWQEFVSEEGGFSVMMPAEPTRSTQETDLGVATVEIVMFQATSGDSVYLASYAEFPEELMSAVTPEDLLPSVVEGAFGGMGGEATEQEEVTVDGYTGIAASGTTEVGGTEATAMGYFFIVDNRLYQLLTLAPTETMAEEDMTTFLESFTLLDSDTGTTDDSMGDADGDIDTGGTDVDTKTGDTTAPAEWELFESQDGGFSILMPVTPEEETQDMDLGVATVTLYMYQATSGESVYLASYADFPEELMSAADPADLLPSVVDGAFGGMSGKVEEQTDITIDGHPGISATGTADVGGTEATVRGYFVIANNRLYQVLTLAPTETMVEEDMTLFLESFTIAE